MARKNVVEPRELRQRRISTGLRRLVCVREYRQERNGTANDDRHRNEAKENDRGPEQPMERAWPHRGTTARGRVFFHTKGEMTGREARISPGERAAKQYFGR